MTETSRIEVKILAGASPPPTADFVRLFHDWIRERTIAELLIDVVDYQHVFQGPAVLLMGYEGQYTWDLGDGTPGLAYQRRRGASGGDAEQLGETIQRTLLAAEHATRALAGLQFSGGGLRLRWLDRRPTREQATARWIPVVNRVASALYGDAPHRLSVSTDSRVPFSITANADGDHPLATLRARITT